MPAPHASAAGRAGRQARARALLLCLAAQVAAGVADGRRLGQRPLPSVLRGLARHPRGVAPTLRLRGAGGCGGGGCGSGGGGACGGSTAREESQTSEDAKTDNEPGCARYADLDLEDGPGDLLDASSSSEPSPARRDRQVAVREQQAIVLAQRREERELAAQAVKRRAEGSLVVNNLDVLVDYFVTTWLETQLRSCWRPIFNALRSDILDDDREENAEGPLTREDLRRIVLSGLEILDEDLVAIEVKDLKASPEWADPAEAEVERRVARYMTLDTNGDGAIDLKEFSIRFLSLARTAMREGVDDAFRADYERDPLALEDDIADKLIAFDKQLQDDVRPLLKLIDTALFPLRTPSERAAALIERSAYSDITPHDIIELARPWDALEDIGDDGSVNVRTRQEAEVGRLEVEAVRHAIEHERWEASALFARALTGLEPPPRPDSECNWPTSGSLDLGGGPAVGAALAPAGKEVVDGAAIPTGEARGSGEATREDAGKGVFEAVGATDKETVLLPPFWELWKRDGDGDAMPRHWHQEALVYSRGHYRCDVSCIYLAGLLSNRAQLFRQVAVCRLWVGGWVGGWVQVGLFSLVLMRARACRRAPRRRSSCRNTWTPPGTRTRATSRRARWRISWRRRSKTLRKLSASCGRVR